MKGSFYSKIAADNLRKNPRLYVPRILAEAGLLACFYIAFALALDDRLAQIQGGDYVIFFMGVGTAILGALSFVLILYVNSFLMKRRKSEYGLYNVLGMEKRHIVRVLFAESVDTFLVSCVLGLAIGLLFYKLFSLLICRLLQADVIAGFYYINARTILLPAGVFAGFDLLAFFFSSLSIRRLKPVELLAESHTGEKEPKVRWLLLVLGVLSLGGGYVLALTAKNSFTALRDFFPAVILVIIGTYFLFVTGTTFVLKCLKLNKKYYYNKKHMPAVSGLLYRMKQNAVGLASIAILATGILVMISTTASLYTGMQSTLDSRYPQQLYLSALYVSDGQILSIPSQSLAEIVTAAADENQVELQSIDTEQYLSVSYLMRDTALLTKAEVTGGWDPDELTNVTFITDSTYAELMNKKLLTTQRTGFQLAPDEIVFCRITVGLDDIGEDPETLTLGGKEYKVKDTLSFFPIQTQLGNGVRSIGVIVSDEAVMEEIYQAQKQGYGDYASEPTDRIAVTFADEEAAEAVGTQLGDSIFDGLHSLGLGELSVTLDAKWDALGDLLGMYGAFLFLGIILGIVCLFSTILIIYYKQISEGYEDRERFQIMQKIGMEQQEVRNTIQSQMVLQFFLPLVTSGIHTAAAFPMLLKLLSLLMLTDPKLAVFCAVLSFAIFALVYVTVYLLTSRTYYKIVR